MQRKKLIVVSDSIILFAFALFFEVSTDIRNFYAIFHSIMKMVEKRRETFGRILI